MKTFTIIIQLLLFLTSHAFSQAEPEIRSNSPQSQFQDAFEILVKADKARDSGSYIKAVELYGKALNAYSEFGDKHPGWKPELTKFRRRYCSNQIDSIRREMESGGASPTKPVETNDVENHVISSNRKLEIPSNTDVQRENYGKRANARARELLNGGQIKKAHDILFQNLQVNPDDTQTRFLLGVIHCRRKKYDNAVHLLEPLTEEVPELAPAHVALAAAYAGANRLAAAEAALATAIEKNPSLAEAHYNMALVQMQKEEPDATAARKHYARSVKVGGKRDRELEKELRIGEDGVRSTE